MSTCIKTGANCYIEEYNGVVRCDVHRFKDIAIINFNNESFDRHEKDIDLQVVIGKGYYNRHQGIIVVKTNQITTNDIVLTDRLFGD